MDTCLQKFRPIPFFFLNTTDADALSLDSARELMGKMKEAGYGGALLFNKPPTGFSNEAYLSEAWYEALENFSIAARENGLVIWINDGWDFPPGDAGRRILKDAPELVQYHLEKMEDGTIQPVETPWGFPAFEEPRSSELFHKYVYEGLKEHLGKFFGDPIVGIFSDADNRRTNAHVLRRLSTHLYYPWSPTLPQQFLERFGYDVTPHLQELFDGADTQAAEDYWCLVSELYQNWFASNYRWCRANGLLYSFHTSDTGPMAPEKCRRSNVFSEGETLKLAANCDYPGTDHELFVLDGGTHYDSRYFVPEVTRGGGLEKWHHPDFACTKFDARAKIVASASCLYKRERTLCEAFAATNWEATPNNLRRIAAWQIIQGINFFIPHAVHVRFFDITKFFAPPEFFRAFPMPALRQFNDFLAKYSMIAAQGEYRPQLALLDPSRRLWRGKGPGKFFEIFDRLNRCAVDYVITDPEHAASFDCVIDPHSDDEPALPQPYAVFTGGEVAYHRRFLPDGTSYFLAANIWNDRTLSGVMTFDGRSVELELAPGEIAVLGGPMEEYRAPAPKPQQTMALPEKWEVKWGAPQRIGFTKSFTWQNSESVSGLTLLIPGDGEARLNGVPLTGGTTVKVFDDTYTAYALPAEPGCYNAEFAPVDFATPAYLSGDYWVEYTSTDDYKETAYDLYCMQIFAPGAEKLVLAQRKSALANGCWTEQGYPFYSGSATYESDVDFPFQPDALELTLEGCWCQLSIDGIAVGSSAFAPFRFPLKGISGGHHKVTITIYNTLANQLEQFRNPGGLFAGCLLKYT